METDDRQFLLLAAWMFLRHGQPARARALCEAVLEEDPRDGAAAAALAQADPLMRIEINEILRYPENSAGSIMT
ncbi:MAG: hypothetical protein IJQ73_12420, partial [Kiritimatiellae bacterium]|nr:hypothetical protein [Kiritimatiellia bacterium]